MSLYWLYDLPDWVFGLISIGFFAAIGAAGLLLSRTWVRRQHKVNHSHNDIVSYFLAAVTVFYGITLGLLAVGAWSNYADVESKVDREAQNMASLFRDVCAYPEPVRDVLQRDLREYVRQVIDVAWPEQQRGILPVKSGAFLDRLQGDLTSFQPETQAQAIIHQETFRNFNDLVEARRARVNSVTSHMPRALWTLVILGAMITIGVTLFFDTASLSLHMWLTLLMSTLLGLMIFLIGALDHPFRGKGSVSPAPIVYVYDQLMRAPMPGEAR